VNEQESSSQILNWTFTIPLQAISSGMLPSYSERWKVMVSHDELAIAIVLLLA